MFCVERRFPLGGAGLASIFHFLPNSEALGARSFSSRLMTGCYSHLLDEAVEELQVGLLYVSIVELDLLLFWLFALGIHLSALVL